MAESGEITSTTKMKEVNIRQDPQVENKGGQENLFASRLAEIRTNTQKIVEDVKGFYQNTTPKSKTPESQGNEIGKFGLINRIRKLLSKEEKISMPKQEPDSTPNQEKMLSKIAQDVKAIVARYGQLTKDIISDGSVPKDIRDNYIQQEIQPEINEATKGQQEGKTKQDEFYRALQAFIDHREESKSQRDPFLQRLREAHFYGYVDWLLQPLIKNEDNIIIESLAAKIAARDIALIKDAVESRISWDSRNKFSNILQETMVPNPSRAWNDEKKSFGEQVFGEIRGYKKSPSDKDIRFWQAVKSSNKANEVFGEEIKSRDQEYCSSILDKSLNPIEVSAIQQLRYYPTPDAIRNLVLIAGENSPSDPSREAGKALRYLSEKPEWKNILDHAEEVYPELKALRTVLETIVSLRDDEYGHYEEIHQSIQNFALSIFEDKTSDPKLKDIAANALSTYSILDILIKKKVVGKSEVAIFKEIEPQTRESLFSYRLRENLLDLIKDDKDLKKEDRQKKLEIVKRFEKLANKISENKSNNEALRFLQNDSVLKKIQDLSLSPENVNSLLSSYEAIPELITDYILLYPFFSQFVGQETIQLFRDMITAYSAFPDKLLPVLDSVHEAKLTKQRALELPVKAEDIVSNEFFPLALSFPNIFIATDQDIEFLREILTSYPNKQDIRIAAIAIENNRLSRELALAFPKKASALMDQKMQETRIFIFNNANTLLKDTSDINFLNSLASEFGNKSDQVIRAYQNCLDGSVISTNDKELFLKFAKQFRIISPAAIKRYKEAEERGHEKVYLAQLRSLAERLTETELITENDFRLFVALHADAALYMHARKLLTDDYFLNIRDAQNRLGQFNKSMLRGEIPDDVLTKIFAVSGKATELDRIALKYEINAEIAKAAQNAEWQGPLLRAVNFQEANEVLTKMMTDLAIPVIYSGLESEELRSKQNELIELASKDKELDDILEINCRAVGVYGQKYPSKGPEFDALMGAIRQSLELNLERNPRVYLEKRAELSKHQFDRIFEGMPQDVRDRVMKTWLDLSPRRRLRVSGEVITAEEATLNRLNRIRDIVHTDLSVHLQELFTAKIRELETAVEKGETNGPGAEQLAIYKQYLMTSDGVVRQDIPMMYRSVGTFIRNAQAALKNPQTPKEEKGKLGKSLGTYQGISDSLKAIYRLGTISEERYEARRNYLNEIDKHIGEFSGALKRLKLLDPDKRPADVNIKALEKEVLLDFGKLKGTMAEENVSRQTAFETESTVDFRNLARAPEVTQSCQRLTEVTGYNHAAYSRLLDGSNEMIDIYEMRNGERNRLARSFVELSKIRLTGEEQSKLIVLIDRVYVNPQYQNFGYQFSSEMMLHMLDRLSVAPDLSLLFDSNRFTTNPNFQEVLQARGYRLKQISGEYFVNESNVKLAKYYDSLGGINKVAQPSWRSFRDFYIIEKI